MATLFAVGYPDQSIAEHARDTVHALESDVIVQADTRRLEEAPQPPTPVAAGS